MKVFKVLLKLTPGEESELINLAGIILDLRNYMARKLKALPKYMSFPRYSDIYHYIEEGGPVFKEVGDYGVDIDKSFLNRLRRAFRRYREGNLNALRHKNIGRHPRRYLVFNYNCIATNDTLYLNMHGGYKFETHLKLAGPYSEVYITKEKNHFYAYLEIEDFEFYERERANNRPVYEDEDEEE